MNKEIDRSTNNGAQLVSIEVPTDCCNLILKLKYDSGLNRK